MFVEKPIRKKLTKNIAKPTRIALISPSFFIVGLNSVNLIPALNIPDIINKNAISIGVRSNTSALKKDMEDITIVKDIV
jgi:hypothetical protein